MKQLIGFTQIEDNNLYINQLMPGTYLSLELSEDNKWYITDKTKYNTFKLNNTTHNDDINTENFIDYILNNIHDKFCNAVKKRVETY